MRGDRTATSETASRGSRASAAKRGPQELEKLVSTYHLARQQLRGDAVCCDLETREHCVCDGWNQFDSADLERFCLQITGSRVSIR